jgi:hypothetical protein
MVEPADAARGVILRLHLRAHHSKEEKRHQLAKKGDAAACVHDVLLPQKVERLSSQKGRKERVKRPLWSSVFCKGL